MRKLASIIILVLLSATMAWADVVSRYIPNAEKVGEGRFTILFWDAYDISLFAPGGRYDEEQPLALKIAYLTEVSGEDIAKISADEIRAQDKASKEQLNLWLAKMLQIFPDVKKGDRIIGVFIPKTGVIRFYKNDVIIGALDNIEFGQQFFDIWLAETTSQPDLRRKLLGLQ